MKNVIMPTGEYASFRQWAYLQSDLVWRDLSSSMMIPAWGECVCDGQFMLGDETPAQHAYGVLQRFYPNLKLKWREDELSLLDARPPLFFEGPIKDSWLYHIDIKGAYSQFYRYLFLHSEWKFKRQKYPLWPIAEYFSQQDTSNQNWKISRNSIIGITRSTRNKWVKGGEVSYTQKVNHYLSPTLWGQLQGLLNQIACRMVELGAVWVNTDGYIFDHAIDYELALAQFAEWGITIHSGYGAGSIYGINSVKIDGVKENKEVIYSRAVVKLSPSDYDFIGQWAKNRKDFNNV